MRILILIIVLQLATSSFADIVVEGAKYEALKIAIPDAKTTASDLLASKLANELVSIVRDDLSWATVFRVLDPKSYIADLGKEGLEKSTINIKNWTQVGAQALVKMQLAIKGQDVSTEIGIHWLGGLKPSKQKTFRANSESIRRLAHQISDEILAFYTGDAGIFGSQIAVAKSSPAGKKIVVIDIDGQNERVLTKESGIHILPTMVPEGDAVLYTAYSDNNANLMQIGVDGTDRKTLSSRSDLNTGAQVSPDRTKMAFTIIKDGSSDIYLAGRSGNNLKKITNTYGINISPSFSPDGSKIAFVSSRSGNPQIYVMDVDGGNAKRVTFQGKYNQTPRYSPKGDFIAFTGRDERNKFDIFLLEISSGKISRVTQDQGNNEDPWFSPNGRLLIFTSTRDGKRDLYVSSLDGNMQRRVTNGGSYWTPSWGPSK